MRHHRILFDRAHCSNCLSGLALLVATIAILLLPGTAMAADPPPQAFDLIYRTESPQKYAISVEGIGMAGVTEETLSNVNLGETGIVKAYLVWAGLGTDPDGVLFARDNELPVSISAPPELTWNKTNNNPTGQNTWNCCGFELSFYAAEITDLGIVSTGTHDYTISGMDIQHGEEDGNWGFSLITVYEDPTLETARNVVIKLGNDGLHYRWGNQLGPNGDVQCIAVDPSNTERRASFDMIIGGIQDNFRPNGLWGLTGDQPFIDYSDKKGATWNQPLGLINLPANPPGSPQFDGIGVEVDGPLDGDRTGNGIDWPFSDARGLEWDEYVLENVVFSPGREWVCVQIESANRPELPPSSRPGFPNYQRGASIGFLGFVAVIEETAPSIEVAVAPTYDWTYTVTNPNNGIAGQPDLQDVRLVAGPYVNVACPQTTLAVGASMTCTAESTDLAYYSSVAWAIGMPVGGGAAVIDVVLPDPRQPQP